jgi:hypothetical protein
MPYRLYRDATRLDITTNTTIKDLSSLNRDLSKVVMLDTDKSHATNQPDNALILPKWTGEPGDQGLVAIIPFLECKSSAAADQSCSPGVLQLSGCMTADLGLPTVHSIRPLYNSHRNLQAYRRSTHPLRLR